MQIGTYSFYKCKQLKTFTVPSTVTFIGDGVFNGCSALTDVYLPDGLAGFGFMTFKDCTALTEITLPSSFSLIDEFAFAGTGLTGITLSQTVGSIENNAFLGSDMLTVYTEHTGKPFGWDSSWNASNRPVVWGCTLSADKKYVVSFTKSSSNIQNPGAANGIKAPYRQGYTFDGWLSAANGQTYPAANVNSAPNGNLTALWTPV